MLDQLYSSYYDNKDSPKYIDLTSELSQSLQRELFTFGLPGRFEALIIAIGNTSSALVNVDYKIAHYFDGDHTHLPHPPVNTLGSVLQVIVQSGWVGPLRTMENSHSLPGRLHALICLHKCNIQL